MGRLSGFSYRAVVKKLRAVGFVFYRHAAGSHEIWHNPRTGKYATIPNHHGDLSEGTLQAIPRQAGVTPEAFLESQ